MGKEVVPLPDDNGLYTVKQVCEILYVTKWTVYNYIRDGLLDARNIGNKYLITGSSINALIAKS
jgi:excisionase family DNA binding protein